MKLSTQSLVKKYKERTVVRDVSIEVKRGEIVGLLGPNGAGKTTTFYMVVGLERPNSGRILLGDRDITGLPMYRRAQLGVGYLPQEVSVFRQLSVEDNILAVLELATRMTRAERKKKADQLIAEFSLEHVRHNKGINLSGGEKRRTEIARALSVDPQFILLDEPFAGVDPIAVGEIQLIVRKLTERNIGVLITDHNVHETLSITERSYLLYQGQILMAGSAEELAENEQVKKVYLGENFRLER
jgi:lipopolysaccharide export system ATP-binding protein